MIAAIVLAAGRSQRMGAQKLLLPYHGKPVIAHIADQLLHVPIDLILIVVGANQADVQSALAPRPVQLVVNPFPDGDMLSSVRAGLAAIPESCPAILVVLGDQPGIRAQLITRLIAAWRSHPAQIAVPVFQGRRGHPVLIPAAFRREILTQHDGIGLRGLLAAHADSVLEVPAPDDAILEVMNTPDDYARALRRQP